jgi:hypothetical protein
MKQGQLGKPSNLLTLSKPQTQYRFQNPSKTFKTISKLGK